MAVQKQADQHEHTFSSYVRIRDVVLKTYLGRWTIGRSGERGSGISVLPERYDDDILYLTGYQSAQFVQRALQYAMAAENSFPRVLNPHVRRLLSNETKVHRLYHVIYIYVYISSSSSSSSANSTESLDSLSILPTMSIIFPGKSVRLHLESALSWCMIGGRWPYSYYLIGYWYLNLLKTARSILALFFSSFLSIHFVWWFGLVSLFNGISTHFRLFNAKAVLLEEQ